MSPADYGLLALAGVGGGLTGSIAGLASLVTYPALLAVGLHPVAANVSNTVALIFSSAGSISGSRLELAGQGARLRRLSWLAILGGAAGGALLLLTPSGQFELIVPWLIGLASVAILLVRPAPIRLARRDGIRLQLGLLVIAVYGGYFGAAAGVLLLALLLVSTSDSLPRSNAAKNVLLGLSNAIAAVGFALFGPVHWLAALPLAGGLFLGGRIGPIVVRHAPPSWLRTVIALAGIGLAVYLGVTAYG